MTAAPLYCFASERLGEGGLWEELDWTWTRAHTDASEIILGTLTALQDWCDRSAPLGARLPLLASEFYEYDVRFPIFCTKTGSLPGLRSRLNLEVASLLAERARTVWTPDSVMNRLTEHADGSRSCRGIDEARIFKLPEKVFRYSNFAPAVPTLRAQLAAPKGAVQSDLSAPFQQVIGLTPFTVKLSQMRMDVGYKRGSRACVHAMGGNLATRARHKSAHELAQGLGHCFLCTAGVCDTQDHFFECKGDCHIALQTVLASLRLSYKLELAHALYSFGVPLGRIEEWHNDRALPRARQPVSRGTNGAVQVRVRAETRTLRSLDEDMAAQGYTRMYKDLVKTGDAQAKRRDRELDLWQVVLDQDPRLRLPVDMKCSTGKAFSLNLLSFTYSAIWATYRQKSWSCGVEHTQMGARLRM